MEQKKARAKLALLARIAQTAVWLHTLAAQLRLQTGIARQALSSRRSALSVLTLQLIPSRAHSAQTVSIAGPALRENTASQRMWLLEMTAALENVTSRRVSSAD